jgi:flavin-dependent dehydrogenase
VHIDGFELAGVPVPEAYKVKRTGLTFIIPGTDLPPLRQGVSEDTYNVEIDRKALYRWLLEPAKEAGVKFEFGCRVTAPIMLGSRVAGLVTDKGDVYADLVIDAAGLYSPVRTQLPEALGIQNEATGTDILHTYRAFFKRDLTAGEPEYKYIVSLIPGEDCGILWAITNETQVDILIASMTHEIDDAYIELRTAQLKAANPVIGEFIRGGRVADIPVRQPLSMLVADGYAAIGDAAFMTMPLNCSGISMSIEASKLLADAIKADRTRTFSAETLWPYQVNFYKQIGFGAAPIALVKDMIIGLTPEQLDTAFDTGLITWRELTITADQHSIRQFLHFDPKLPRRGLTIVKDPALVKKALGVVADCAAFASHMPALPKTYSRDKVQRWARRYDRIFTRHLPY